MQSCPDLHAIVSLSPYIWQNSDNCSLSVITSALSMQHCNLRGPSLPSGLQCIINRTYWLTICYVTPSSRGVMHYGGNQSMPWDGRRWCPLRILCRIIEEQTEVSKSLADESWGLWVDEHNGSNEQMKCAAVTGTRDNDGPHRGRHSTC